MPSHPAYCHHRPWPQGHPNLLGLPSVCFLSEQEALPHISLHLSKQPHSPKAHNYFLLSYSRPKIIAGLEPLFTSNCTPSIILISSTPHSDHPLSLQHNNPDFSNSMLIHVRMDNLYILPPFPCPSQPHSPP